MRVQRRKLLRNLIGASALLIAAGLGNSNAAVVMTLMEQGSDVVLTGGGTIDLDGLTLLSSNVPFSATARPSTGVIYTLNGNSSSPSQYFTSISGPANFGSGTTGWTTFNGAGDQFGVLYTNNALIVPADYISNTSLSGSATWSSLSLATLGVTPGAYTWTWGSGEHADSLTLNVVPEPATWTFIGLGFCGLLFFRQRLARL